MQALLTTLFLPPAGPLLLALLGLLLKRRWLAGLGIGLAVLLSTEAVVDPLSRAYTQTRPAAETLARARAFQGQQDSLVLVLGAGVRRGAAADGGYELKPLTAERLQRGLWWARELKLPLAFSGGTSHREDRQAPTEAAMVARFLQESGAPAAIWLEGASQDTRDNARLSAPLLQQGGTKRLILVTHALHMPRALKHFRAGLPEVEILPAPLGVDAREDGSSLLDWLPTPSGAARGSYLAYELAARLAQH